VQQHCPVESDLAWDDVPATVATVTQFYEGPGFGQPDLALWVGAVTFAAPPDPGRFRLLIEEFEFVSANYADQGKVPGRLIYAETFAVDASLISE
jgi:hypothetical protein